jgi:RND family efflux transporter MFP subunit
MHYLKIIPAIAVLYIFLSSCGSPKEETVNTAGDIIPVQLLPLNKSAAATTVTASGRFTTDDEVFLSFKTGGIVNKVLVKEGDAVRPGQLLATLNPTEIDAQVGQAKAGFEKAQRDHQRAGNLYGDSVASLEQLQDSKTALDLAQQQLAAARFNRSYSEIRATQAGYVLRKLVNEGQVMAPGTPVLQTNGAGNGTWFLRIGVSDRDWAAIRVDDKAIISSEAASGKQYKGIVFRRAESVDPYTGSFAIDIRIDKGEGMQLASGMYGRAVITTGQTAEASAAGTSWAIPYDALLDGDGSTGYVFVTNDDKTAQKVKVTIAGMDKDRIWIRQGLENARSLIISGSAYLNDNSRIKVMP